MRPGTLHHCSDRAIAAGVVVLLFLPVLAGAQGLIARRDRHLNLAVGQSIFLHFERMTRVQVVEPETIDVIVASLNDLSVYGKKAGDTVLYVWDHTGVHQIDVRVVARTLAEAMIESLRGALGAQLTYTPAGEKTVVIEGLLPAAEAQRARNIIAVAGREGVQLVDLIRVEGDTNVGAATLLAEQLSKILGHDLEYLTWGGNTLIVQGGIGDKTELAQAHTLLTALSTDQVKIIDMLQYQESAARPPVLLIAQALGDKFHVWQIAGRTVAVEGRVDDEQELANLNKILAAFSDQAQIVNLVRVGKPDINQAMIALQQLVGPKITVRPLDGNALIVDGTVPSDAALVRLREIIASYPVGYKLVDLLRVALPEKLQVQVHVRIVDINKTALERLGVNWGQLSFNSDGTVAFVGQPWLIHNLGSSLGGGSNRQGNVLAIGAQLDALRQTNLARVLSEPNLLVDDGGKATIQVGGEIPIPVAQTGGGGGGSITVEWKPFGVLLQIEPTILESGDKLNLKVVPEVSSLDFANAVTINGFVLPALRQRKASTVVTVVNGGTLVIGGLIANDESRNISKLPLLGDLPIIGQLFRRKEFQRNESELVILVTPTICTTPPPIPAIGQPAKAP